MKRFITLIQRDLVESCAISSHLVEFKAERERDNGSVRLYVTVASEQPNAELRKKGK